MFEKMLVCLDGSEFAEKILPYATELALRFKSVAVVMHVLQLPMGAPSYVGELVENEVNKETREASEYLNGVAESLKAKGVTVETVVVQGGGGENIVAFAHQNNIDLIALVSHGRRGIGRAIFGSVADYVVRESGLPVLVYKPYEEHETDKE